MPLSKSHKVEAHDHFDFEGSDYRALFEASDATVFQDPQWLSLLYAKLGPACGVRPLVITVRDRRDDSLCLVLPLMRTSYAGLSCVEPADLGTADYNAIVMRSDCEEALLGDDTISAELLKLLKPCHLVFFRKMKGDSRVLAHLLGKVIVADMVSSSHDMPIWAPYEDWRNEVLSKSFRTGLRRKFRKLEQQGDVTLKVISGKQEILAVMRLLQEQRRSRYPEDLFLDQAYYDFYCTVAIEGEKTGLAEVTALHVGDDIVGIELGFLKDRCYHFILAGMDNDAYGKMSPGLHLIDYILAHRVECGDTRADFTIGDERYKASFGAKPTRLRLMARARTPLGALALKAYMSGGPIKELVKRVAAIAKR
ncbi:GNAT family N-acetyltransferase [uncultured Cohaesibacter sp.]|uniref:GNAT family N-acetyltransferase n=1 Tax=uncultured Cohaesibacter sp. TaxID=1002546 RepID=UPI0029C853D9|nr:GNAT family N-acetyltransferase [uncultured Cohaesibacter sp.]